MIVEIGMGVMVGKVVMAKDWYWKGKGKGKEGGAEGRKRGGEEEVQLQKLPLHKVRLNWPPSLLVLLRPQRPMHPATNQDQPFRLLLSKRKNL